MSQTQVKPLGIRLFLEGVEVPVISAQVNAQPNRPATAAIQIVPSEMSLHFLPRTLVHLFFLDVDAVLPEPSEKLRTSEDANIYHNLNRFDALDSQYKLMFCGEIIGYNFGKDPSSRQLILQCMDLSTYWDTCYQWYADYSPGGGGLTDHTHQFAASKKGVFNSISGGHSWVIGRLINTKPKNPAYQNAEGLLAGILHVLEVIGGLKYKSSSDQGANGVNDFFTIAELRYNLTGMLGAVEKDVTSAKLYQNKAFKSWLRNGMTSLGTLVSFRDIINHVNRFIFHNIYPQVCPYFLEAETAEIAAESQTSIYTDDFGAGALINTAIKKCIGAMYKAASYFKAVGDGNATPLVGFLVGGPLVPEAADWIQKAINAAEGLDTDDKSDIQSNLKDAQSSIKEAQSKLDSSGYKPDADPEQQSINNGVSVAQGIVDLFIDAQLVLKNNILSPKARARKIKPREVQVIEGAHLFTQMILPELFFVAPPNCNVIFPDQYTQFNFSRNFMREVSRLMCRGGNGLLRGRRGWQIFGRAYYAPEIRDVEGKLVFLTNDRGSSVIMPHEVHSGIIPKFEWVTDGHRWAVKAAKETGAYDKFQESGKVGYIQRLANFQFFLHRFSARTMSIAGVFNPNIALGFPALVLDRSMPAPAVAKKLKELFGRRWLPMQYLGKVETLTHNINQQGGLTNITLSKCRTHRGLDDEFLGTLVRELYISAATGKAGSGLKEDYRFRTKNLLKPGENTEQDLLREQWRTLIRDYVKNNKTIAQGYKVTIDRSPARVLEYSNTKQTTFFTEQELVKGFGLESSDASDEGPGKEKGLFLPTLFKIKIEIAVVGLGSFEVFKATPEDALYPGFYSDVYKNDSIGQDVYNFLLGSRAITDEVSLNAEAQDQLLDELFEEDVREAIADSRPEFDFAGETTTSSTTEDGTEVTVAPGSIEEAIDAITMIYGLIRHRGGDVHQFIRDFTTRPIATLEDVLGSQNLVYDDDGNPTAAEGSDSEYFVEGFHSRAYGDFNADVKWPTEEDGTTEPGKDALHALYPGVAKGTEVKRKTLIDKGEDPLPLAPELDPRGRARARVKAYLQELSISRGLLG